MRMATARARGFRAEGNAISLARGLTLSQKYTNVPLCHPTTTGLLSPESTCSAGLGKSLIPPNSPRSQTPSMQRSVFQAKAQASLPGQSPSFPERKWL